MSGRYRIFGANTQEPEPEGLLRFLANLGKEIEGHFQGDDQGWFRLRIVRDGVTMQIDRYLVSEEGLRAELNTWAAWVEAATAGAEAMVLMQQVISTQQLMVLQDFHVELAVSVARHLAGLTEGVYQVDEQGFFTAGGELLLAE